MKICRTTSDNPDFIILVQDLDADLALKNGDANSFFAQHNTIEKLKNVVLIYDENIPVGCGAIKQYDAESMEIKRMFVLPEKRGNGIASLILNELETWAKELGFKRCILETGEKMKAAIRLYEKSNFKKMANYPPYEEIVDSICFEKVLK